MCCSKFLKNLSSRFLLGAIFSLCAAILTMAYVLKNSYGVLPCQMCLYEQWIFMGAGSLALLGFLLCSPIWQKRILFLLGFVFLGEMLTAAYHVAIQQHWVSLPAFCASQDFSSFDSVEALREQMLNTPFVRCDQITWSLFGLSLAAYNVLISSLLMLFCWNWLFLNRASSCQ